MAMRDYCCRDTALLYASTVLLWSCLEIATIVAKNNASLFTEIRRSKHPVIYFWRALLSLCENQLQHTITGPCYLQIYPPPQPWLELL